MITRLSFFIVVLSSITCEARLAAQERKSASIVERILRDDANGDGEITKSEFKGPPRLFARFDRNGDGVLTKDELERVSRRRGRRKPVVIPDDVAVSRDVVFGRGGGRSLKMDIVRPKERGEDALPVYVWIHGGGWRQGNKEGGLERAVRFAKLGFVGATIEYRLSGEATFPAQIEDCKCAIRFLRAQAKTYGLDPERIAVGGSSAGGHLAALLGTSGDVKELEGNGGWLEHSSRVQAVVDFYGPTDLIRFAKTPGYESHARSNSPESRLLGGDVLRHPERAAKANPIAYVDEHDPPFLIIHGSNDRTVPPNQSTLLDEALKKAGVRTALHVIDGAGHGGPAFASPKIRKLEEAFLLEILKRRKASSR